MVSKHFQVTKEILKSQASKYTPTWLINDIIIFYISKDSFAT